MADEIVEMVPMDKCGVFTGKSIEDAKRKAADCLLYTSPSPRDLSTSRMPSSA